MSTFQSPLQEINCNIEQVRTILSDFKQLEELKNQLSHKQVDKIRFSGDTCYVFIKQVGEIGLHYASADHINQVRLVADNSSPIPFTLDINLSKQSEDTTSIQLVLNAKLSPFLKLMVAKHIDKFLEEVIEVFSAIDYNVKQ